MIKGSVDEIDKEDVSLTSCHFSNQLITVSMDTENRSMDNNSGNPSLDQESQVPNTGDDDGTEGPEFKHLDLVDVMPRLWAGINKPGGIGRISKVNYDAEEDQYTYNVAYVHGGGETKVERIYINLVHEETIGKKQRQTRGRCRYESSIQNSPKATPN